MHNNGIRAAYHTNYYAQQYFGINPTNTPVQCDRLSMSSAWLTYAFGQTFIPNDWNPLIDRPPQVVAWISNHNGWMFALSQDKSAIITMSNTSS